MITMFEMKKAIKLQRAEHKTHLIEKERIKGEKEREKDREKKWQSMQLPDIPGNDFSLLDDGSGFARVILFLSLGYRYRHNRSCETLSRREWKADDRIKANRSTWRRYWRIEREVNQRWFCGRVGKIAQKHFWENRLIHLSFRVKYKRGLVFYYNHIK